MSHEWGGRAPHFVWPLTFVMPHPGKGLQGWFSQLMTPRTQVEWRAQSGWAVSVWMDIDRVEMVLLHSCRSGLRLCGGGVCWNVIDVLVCFLVLSRQWHCLWTSGGLPVVGQNFLENWASLTNRMVFLCVLVLPSCVLNAHFWQHPSSGHDWMGVIGYLVPHACHSWGLQGHLCSSAHLVSVAPKLNYVESATFTVSKF